MTGEYSCCVHCAGIARDDHVEHGGSVEENGHDVPCDSCEFELRVRPRLAQAWDEGAQKRAQYDPSMSVRDLNPYRAAPVPTVEVPS